MRQIDKATADDVLSILLEVKADYRMGCVQYKQTTVKCILMDYRLADQQEPELIKEPRYHQELPYNTLLSVQH